MQNVILLKIHKAIHFHGDYCKFVLRCRGLIAEWLKLKENLLLAFIVAFTGKYQDHIN